METYWYTKKHFNKKGARLIPEFTKQFQDVFATDVCKYAEMSKRDIGLEHIFWEGEQQLKTAVTTTLYSICNGFFMQEVPVSRRVEKRISGKQRLQPGRVDYWCRIGDSTRISLLIEVKQEWIRYYHPDKITRLGNVVKKHNQAITQIKDIDKKDFMEDNLFGIALTLLPIFVKYTSQVDKIIKISNQVLENICKKAMNETNSHACGGFVMPPELQKIFHWPEAGRERYESYPGFIFVWSIYKSTKK